MKNKMKCPICKNEVNRENECWPFCCEKCRMIDLYNWLSEEYNISDAQRDLEICEEAEENLANYHKKLTKEADEALELAKKILKEKE